MTFLISSHSNLCATLQYNKCTPISILQISIQNVYIFRMDVVGGGFNPAPNGALLVPRRVVPPISSQSGGVQGTSSLPTLQGTKLAPGIQGLPQHPPPPYQGQGQDSQYGQSTPGRAL